MADTYQIVPYGDAAILITYGETFTINIWKTVHYNANILAKAHIPGVIEVFPTYTTIMLSFDLTITSLDKITVAVTDALTAAQVAKVPLQRKKYFQLPLVFGGKAGLDVAFLSAYLNMSPQEICNSFCNEYHPIFTFATFGGFLMGGPTFEKSIPRLASPRLSAPAGGIAIAGNKVAVMPVSAPSGWRYIGYSPIKFFTIDRTLQIPYRPGDYVKFFPITEEESKIYHSQLPIETEVET